MFASVQSDQVDMEEIMVLENKIGSKLAAFKHAGQKAFVSSSFQSHSLPLLHLISRFDNSIPVYFLNTGFHFPETLIFRHEIAERFGLNVIDAVSPVTKAGQRDSQGKFIYVNNPDHCCYLNKVLPLEPVIEKHDIWINGVRRDQTKFRSHLEEVETMPGGKLRYHPMLDWNSKLIWEYRKKHNLPEHPLEAQGYFSIGCMPCTRSVSEMSEGRSGRWSGMAKDECGIQTEFVKPKT